MNINIFHNYNPIITSQLPHPDSPHHYTSWPMTTRTLALDSAGRGQSSNFNSATTIDYCCCYKQKKSTDLEAGLVWFGLSIREFHHIIFEDRTFKNQIEIKIIHIQWAWGVWLSWSCCEVGGCLRECLLEKGGTVPVCVKLWPLL